MSGLSPRQLRDSWAARARNAAQWALMHLLPYATPKRVWRRLRADLGLPPEDGGEARGVHWCAQHICFIAVRFEHTSSMLRTRQPSCTHPPPHPPACPLALTHPPAPQPPPPAAPAAALPLSPSCACSARSSSSLGRSHNPRSSSARSRLGRAARSRIARSRSLWRARPAGWCSRGLGPPR